MKINTNILEAECSKCKSHEKMANEIAGEHDIDAFVENLIL